MDIKVNFVNYLPADITSLITQQLDDPADVVRAAAVSPAWRHYTTLSTGILLRESKTYFVLLEREHNIFCSLLRPLSKKSIRSSRDIIGYAMGASSTYNNEITNIMHTLTSVERFSCGNAVFWSSKGATNPDVAEHLLYHLRNEICVVSQIELQPFGEAILEPGNHVYSPISVRFQMGYPKPTKYLQALGDHISPDDYIWTYTSPVYPVRQEANLHEFKLPEPVVCLGGVVMVELIGWAQKNEQDGLYYIRCVSQHFICRP